MGSRMRSFLIVSVLLAAMLPSLALAQQATPVAELGVAVSMSPIALFETLRETPFPDELLPEGVSSLRPYAWRDGTDPDLAGSIGAVIYADGDPFGARPPTAITFMIFPNPDGPLAPMALVEEFGEPAEIGSEGRTTPAARIDLGGTIGVFTIVGNVLVYGMAPSGEDADEAAAALTEAGLTHFNQLASGGVARATPVSGATESAKAAFLAMAASRFPEGDLPFEVGELVVLPMPVSSKESAAGLLGALTVRDADRTYRDPIAIYAFYRDETSARAALAEAKRLAGAAAQVALPPDFESPYPTTMTERVNGTTRVMVQVGATLVTVEAAKGDRDARHAAALTLAEIAAGHLEEVAGQRGDP